MEDELHSEATLFHTRRISRLTASKPLFEKVQCRAGDATPEIQTLGTGSPALMAPSVPPQCCC